ncbi:hypothetical protein [Sulfurimonas autotrophica]|uniref:Uncharacterized protein n=1 Tax=Sulfurimonas autotrophica (strain ATCC BAA-671 / DSM 16294 / JCM 11897 / OK10) TaxID=563040 RepID=E0UQ74_SULAO|nr:hypothetical protein [Sulfurimonas autotrophica]ADN09817.1 conserved hypothetical protein [Sulfurimonas autotrophica DSM 16294]
MLENIIQDRDFALLMKKNIQELITLFFQKEQNFGILCKIEDVSFEPELPESINTEFRPLTLFFLAGYTFETARIENNLLIFEAGFGSDNFGSIVSVPLLSILQIIIDETPVLINISAYKEEESKEKDNVDESGVENSMASFLSNPENSKFLK